MKKGVTEMEKKIEQKCVQTPPYVYNQRAELEKEREREKNKLKVHKIYPQK